MPKNYAKITRIIILLMVVFLVLGISSCGGGGASESSDTPTDTDTDTSARWTFMVYLCSDNNLEYYDYLDVKEMESVGSSRQVNILVQWDRKGFDDSVDWSGCRRYYVVQDPEGSDEIKSTLIEDMGDVNMGDPDNLVNFVQWGINNYPADKYAVILWNHGSGWKLQTEKKEPTKSICEDDTSGDSLSLEEVARAFESIKSSAGKKIEMVGMDACVMGMIEVAYPLRNYVNYVTFSQASEPASGWSYDGFLQELVNNPYMSGKQLGVYIVESYGEYYSSNGSVTQSCIDLSEIENLTTKINEFSNYSLESTTAEKAIMNSCGESTQTFDSLFSEYKDMGDFMDRVISDTEDDQIGIYAQEVLTALDSTVVASYKGSALKTASGLSIWIPDSSEFSRDLTTYQQLEFGEDTRWDEFIEEILTVSE